MTLAERIRAASNALRSYADDGTLFVNRETGRAIVAAVCEHFESLADTAARQRLPAPALPDEGELPENVIRFDFLVRASKAARDLGGDAS